MQHSEEPRVSAWLWLRLGSSALPEAEPGQIPERAQLPRAARDKADTPHCHRREQEGREATADLLDSTVEI